MYFNDTIAAIATPIGEGGIGIIRLSGPKAKEIALRILKRPNGQFFKEIRDHFLYYGMVVDPILETPIDEALFFYAQKPRSYTAEDVVEIQAHGGMLVLSKILEIFLQNGARLATPGEFTQRAFLNGRIDLVQAESIIDLIRAKSDKAHQIALNQLIGKTSKIIEKIEENLYRILIAIEAVLDFPEEGISEPDQKQIIDIAENSLKEITEIVKNFDEGRKIREGVMIVIAGRPNVGKSSLLNKLVNEERAIVTDIPGTTRDIIEAQLQMGGIPVRLVDTAGLRLTDNPIEQIGIKKAENCMEEADLILFVIDNSEALNTEDYEVAARLKNKKTILVINKIDIPSRINKEDMLAHIIEFGNFELIEVSAVTGEGFEKLKKKIIEMVGIGQIVVDDRPILTRIRQKNALEKTADAIRSFLNGMAAGISEDLLAVDLREALAAIGEITGKNVQEEVVSGIFAQFCIGK